MASQLSLNTNVSLGIVPTHLKFVGGLVPDEDGRIPRDADGQLTVVANLAKLGADSRFPVTAAQVPYFPGLHEGDVAEMAAGIKALGMEVHFIMMVGGADPMNPADEDAVVGMLRGGLEAAKKHGVTHVSSTSIEEWMNPDAGVKTGAEYDAAVAQNVKLHVRAYRDAGVEGSCIKHWHIEFLRSVEFQTFTTIARARPIITGCNAELGHSSFKLMVDAAHCGDGELSIAENSALIAELAEADELGIFHASAKTTRGCLSTDDGWIGALMAAAAKTGKLDYVFVELFHHEDAALAGLREADPRHGIDTTDGRSYDDTVLDGVYSVGRRLNNLVARGYLAGR
jgi:hypothetical protein